MSEEFMLVFESFGSPLAMTQLIWEPGTWRRMRNGMTLAFESSTVSRAPTRRPAGTGGVQNFREHGRVKRLNSKLCVTVIIHYSQHGQKQRRVTVKGEQLK